MGRKKGSPQRDAKLRDFHNAELARRYLLEHQSQREIAEALGVSQQSVSRDLKQLLAHWRTQVNEDLWVVLAEQLARITLIEAELWRSWHLSTQDVVDVRLERQVDGRSSTHTVSYRLPPEGENVEATTSEHEPELPAPTPPPPLFPPGAELHGEVLRAVTVRRSQLGDPRFLRGIQRCAEIRAKFFGLYDPKQVAQRQHEPLREPPPAKPIVWIAIGPDALRMFGVAVLRSRLGRAMLTMDADERKVLFDTLRALRRNISKLNGLLYPRE